MPKTYQTVDAKANALIAHVMQAYHQRLVDADVKVSTIFAYASKNKDGEATGCAIEVGGYSAIACIKINNLKLRVEGLGDATMTLDGDQWPDMPEARQISLVDHELTHLELSLDDAGMIKKDDVGRPVLKARKHDWQLGGFAEVAERHREESHDVIAVKNVGSHLVRQGLLPGF